MNETITILDDNGRECRIPAGMRDQVWAAFRADRPDEAALLASGDTSDESAWMDACESWSLWTNALITVVLDNQPS